MICLILAMTKLSDKNLDYIYLLTIFVNNYSNFDFVQLLGIAIPSLEENIFKVLY